MFSLAITTVALSDATVSILNIPAWAVSVSSGWTPPWEVPGMGLMICCVVGMQFALLRTHQAEHSSGYHSTLTPATEGWYCLSASSSAFNAVIIFCCSHPSSCSTMPCGLAFCFLKASAADRCLLCSWPVPPTAVCCAHIPPHFFLDEVSLHSCCLFCSLFYC